MSKANDSQGGPLMSLLTTLVLAGLILGGLWLWSRPLSGQAGQSAPLPTAVVAESWPTTGPTFTPEPTITPVPTATSMPTATPPPPTAIVIRNVEQIAELTVMKLTVSAVQTMKGEDARFLGLPVPRTAESITVEYVAHVKIGYEFSQIEYQTDSGKVVVNLP